MTPICTTLIDRTNLLHIEKYKKREERHLIMPSKLKLSNTTFGTGSVKYMWIRTIHEQRSDGFHLLDRLQWETLKYLSRDLTWYWSTFDHFNFGHFSLSRSGSEDIKTTEDATNRGLWSLKGQLHAHFQPLGHGPPSAGNHTNGCGTEGDNSEVILWNGADGLTVEVVCKLYPC